MVEPSIQLASKKNGLTKITFFRFGYRLFKYRPNLMNIDVEVELTIKCCNSKQCANFCKIFQFISLASEGGKLRK